MYSNLIYMCGSLLEGGSSGEIVDDEVGGSKLIGFVLSGGGNRGALQAGALEVLYENAIFPDLYVGTSAGALNATFMATHPGLDGAYELADIWSDVEQEDIFERRWLKKAYRLLTGKPILSGKALRKFAKSLIPKGVETFGDLPSGVDLYLTSANLNTGQLYLFGGIPEAPLLDAALASAAHPILWPPVIYEGWQLVDGGVVANVPIGVAIDKGATEIYVLNTGYSGKIVEDREVMLGVAMRSIDLMMYQQFLMDMRYATDQEVVIHNVVLDQFRETEIWEVEYGEQMVEVGRETMQRYLEDGPDQLASFEALLPPGVEEITLR